MTKNYFFSLLIVLTAFTLKAQTACQEQLGMSTHVAGYRIGQSVTMTGCSGAFESIELDRISGYGGAISYAILNIYEGENVSVGAIYTQTNVVIPDTGSKFTIDLGGGIGTLDFEENEKYTFVISNIPVIRLDILQNSSYTGGQMYVNNNFTSGFDLWFKLMITPPESLSNEEEFLEAHQIHPNPSSDFITISNVNTMSSYQIVNLQGKIVKEGTVSSNNTQIDIRNFSNGMYFLKLKDKNPVRFVKN